jgi:hypothetical protein
MSVKAAPAPIICPCCQCENPHDAVFCGNAECHKALGKFRYVIEELAAQSTSLERLADKVTLHRPPAFRHDTRPLVPRLARISHRWYGRRPYLVA